MTIEPTVTKIKRLSMIYLLLGLRALIVSFPLFWTISTSLKTPSQVTVRQINLIPHPIGWANYREIFKVAPIGRYMRNSSIMVIFSLFGGLVTCSLAGYAFARIPFPGRNLLFLILLSTMMIPHVIQIIPLFVMFDRLGWVNTFLPLIVPRILGHNAFYIFLMRHFPEVFLKNSVKLLVLTGLLSLASGGRLFCRFHNQCWRQWRYSLSSLPGTISSRH